MPNCPNYERTYSTNWYSILCRKSNWHVYSNGAQAFHGYDSQTRSIYGYRKELRDKFVNEVCKTDCSKCNFMKPREEV